MLEPMQTKTFFAPTKEAARREARHWADAQKDVYMPMSSSIRQSEVGGWILTVTYQIRPAKEQ
jgi:hypothetical protein